MFDIRKGRQLEPAETRGAEKFPECRFEEIAHRVVFAKPFALSRHEITFDQYAKFANSTGVDMPDDNGWGRSNRPVINVSVSDAKAFARWLSQQTGNRYRLPTESEWEYAARAKSRTLFWWGNEPKDGFANCRRGCGIGSGSIFKGSKTLEVGRLSENPFRLFDMNGNVSEWVQDCFHNNYKGAPRNGRAWQSAGCRNNIRRGGSHKSSAKNTRNAFRESVPKNFQDSATGFRLAYDLKDGD